ncbi:YedE-related selenium metabolism membrane protein [Sedimentibacter sp. zth1]|uniref:YedE family putative selenium transporter n=1 Tax=Sedimentibacter sp. zth1 TaxID=2816908 RepID=UPI001A937408|nr:YedE family putative selenium transporter [Sedimentibacter sp. zth1]QSX07336.1 YedE-related selenium metabolism membrane protein [Sedimentibacter sp. zth1]
MESKKFIALSGAIIGIIAVILVKLGNPLNMGFCIACFERDIAGAIGLHRANVVQYLRPEIIGLIFGAFICAIASKEFKSKGGSSPVTRFFLSIAVMIGALMFLGCPLRMVLRIAGGDLNAIVGLVGFVIGILIGILFLNKGFTLKRNYKTSSFDGYVMPIIMIGMLALLVVKPAFIFFSESGPGSLHAPIVVSLIGGLIVGAIAQKSRICMVGGIRDAILFKETHLLIGFMSILVVTLIGNLITGNFNLGFLNQPVAHNDWLWNILGMALVGWASVLLGGCPLRQLILTGEGNVDSAVSVLGMIIGAAIVHNFSLASSPDGPTSNGKIAVIICFIFVFIVSIVNSITKKQIKNN